MKFKALAAAVICAASSLCAPAVVVTPSVASVSGVTSFDTISRLMVGSIRKARPASSAVQPAVVMGQPVQGWPVITGVSNKFAHIGSPVNHFSALAALSDAQGPSPETGYSFMLLTGLAVMGAIALRRGGGQRG